METTTLINIRWSHTNKLLV